MLLTIGDLKTCVRNDMASLVVRLQDATGRFGEEEATAWRNSLPALAELLSSPGFDPFHVFFADRGHTSLEYQLPAASSWCDAILLGNQSGRPSALVMELKHWVVANDEPGPAEGLVMHAGMLHLHPSKQVAGYTEYIRRFHSEVLDRNAIVNGCVFFTRSGSASRYAEPPNDSLAAYYPIFTTHTVDVEQRFPAYASKLLTEPSESFAQSFEQGRYRQDRGFVKQIGQQILDPTGSPFVLIDRQEEAFLLCRERARRAVDVRSGAGKKHVVIVYGPPGSGKSVVAARLWASLVTDSATKDGDIVITTTSASQNSNWVHLVEKAARLGGAGGVIKKATGYHPISTHSVGRLRGAHGANLFGDAVAWRANLQLLRKLQPFQTGAEDDAYLVSLVDEAHALINPEQSSGRGQFGFAPTLGPQAYHIIRCSRLTIFFMDPDQGFRERENTSVEDIAHWAEELGASVEQVDLSGAQFRCAGSKEYSDWVEILRSNTHPQIAARHAMRWKSKGSAAHEPAPAFAVAEPAAAWYIPPRSMEFELVQSPNVLEQRLRPMEQRGFSVRLLASYCREWRTREALSPHGLPPNMLDFQVPYRDVDGRERIWSRPWNHVPGGSGDYTLYVQAVPGSAMAADPLCEVGCPYAVRGFDFDYVGLLWGLDLVWRKDRWCVQPEHVFESGISLATRRANREPDISGPAHVTLLNHVWQSYRILLTRAMRGVYVYVEDAETRNYLGVACGDVGRNL